MSLLDTLSVDDYAVVGRALAIAERHLPALAFLEESLRLNPDNPDVMVNCSHPLQGLGRSEEAMDILRKAIFLQPQNASAWLNLGTILFKVGMFPVALEALQTGLLIEGPLRNKFWSNLGATYLYMGHHEAAIEQFRNGIAADQNDHMSRMSLGMLLMAQGRWTEGLPHYNGRLCYSNPFPLREQDLPIWWGTDKPPGPRILVVAEQGIGDVFMFARYAPAIKSLDPDYRLTLFVNASLVDIMRRFPGFDAVVSSAERVIPAQDCQIALGSLPHALMQAGQTFLFPPSVITLDANTVVR